MAGDAVLLGDLQEGGREVVDVPETTPLEGDVGVPALDFRVEQSREEVAVDLRVQCVVLARHGDRQHA